jgi:23S rRNA pseudouridine1911/1915/1917 synthase
LNEIKLEWRVSPEEDGMLLREFLLKEKGISRRALTAIKFEGGQILVNDFPVTVRHLLRSSDRIMIVFPPEKRSLGIPPENKKLDIVYEDEHILVVNKPPFMAVIPSRDHQSGTLANALIHYYNENGWNFTIHIVNRLDRNTSGLMVVAKHRLAHYLFSEQHKAGKLKRRYEALVHGFVKEDSGVIRAPIGRKKDSIIEREVTEDGQAAVTHFRVLKHIPAKDMSWLSLQLETGRTHQIRVHLSNMGHPLIGDDLYGGRLININRQALHSKVLSFYHPILEKDLHFSIGLPDDIISCMGT